MTPAQQRVLAALRWTFTPDELVLLEADDIRYLLELQQHGLPDIPREDLMAAALSYRDHVRRKLFPSGQ